MNGRLKFLQVLGICLGLSACQQIKEQLLPALSNSQTTATPVAVGSTNTSAAGIPDLTGCWQLLNSTTSGVAKVDIIRVSPTAFGFGSTPETRLQMNGHSFSEINRDDNKPYYPKGTVFSTGLLSEDGQTLNRTLADGTVYQYTRCSGP